MAVRREVPFKERDEGFRDAVIFWSVLDHSVGLGKRPSILIAQDESFSRPELITSAKDAGVRLQIFRTVRDLVDDVQSRLAASLRRSLEEDQERARRAVLEIREAVEAFIIENLIFYEYDLATLLGTVRGISRIAVNDIRSVRTSLDIPLPTTKVEVKISFEAGIDVHITVERYSMPAPRAVRVGEELPPAELETLGAVLAGPERAEQTFSKIVEMEASAVRTEAGNYMNIRLESVRLQRSLSALGR